MTQRPEKTEAEGGRATTPRPPLALVADDEPSMRGLVCEVLGRAGFETLTAADGMELIELAQRQRPRLIVVDVMMPRMDGYTTIARLRGLPGMAAIPVIVITGRLDPAFSVLSAGVGATVHLTKPFLPGALVEAARRAVEGTPT